MHQLWKALQPTYDGPYQVLDRSDKVYKLRIYGKTVHVTVDRLKPAYMLADEELTPASKQVPKMQGDSPPAEKTTRSGRVSRKTARFQSPN